MPLLSPQLVSVCLCWCHKVLNKSVNQEKLCPVNPKAATLISSLPSLETQKQGVKSCREDRARRVEGLGMDQQDMEDMGILHSHVCEETALDFWAEENVLVFGDMRMHLWGDMHTAQGFKTSSAGTVDT